MAEHILVLYVPPALFHFTDTATPETYTLSLHDALPILSGIVELPKGFQLSPILQFGSARPYNLTNSSNTLNTGGGTASAVVVPTNAPTNWFAFAGNATGAQNCFYGLNGVTQDRKSVV